MGKKNDTFLLDSLNPNRRWKVIKKFKNVVDNTYKVSDDGLILRINDGKILHKKICNKMKHPYESVNLKLITGKQGWILVHQIVATFFCKIPEKYKNTKDLVVDHLDNNGLNNVYTNLTWKSRGDNTRESLSIRKDHVNNDKRNIELTDGVVEDICLMLEARYTYKRICEELGIDYIYNNVKPISEIKNGKIFTEISEKYNIDKYMLPSSDGQTDIQQNLLVIKALIDLGKSNSDICKLLWPYLKGKHYNTRVNAINRIRKGETHNSSNTTENQAQT